ncbi:MAG: tRNA(Ile)(2)-agmatinylcytidine synthase [Candidatus Bathyarchaeia archaeon]
MELHIGIDDTDSKTGGCTTYIAARLVEKLCKLGAQFIDYPNIIRLNPNIPYKTRGNAAVALRLKIPANLYSTVQEETIEEVEANSRIGSAGTDPAIAFLDGKPPGMVRRLARKALRDIVSEHEAQETITRNKITALAYGSRLGLVGALSAVGECLENDHTFELVAYRERKNWGTRRRVEERSVMRMDRLTAPWTFNSYDFDNKRTLVTPHGPDPVLLGIRGENPHILLKAFRMLRIGEPIERWVIFRTNHGTDAHISASRLNTRVRPFRPVALNGVVAEKPERIRGGHVFFTLRYDRSSLRCAAFEPTGRFREVVARLIPGDEVTAFGGLKKRAGFPLVLNLEKLQIHRLEESISIENPACPKCKKHLKSAGKAQGFRCSRCSFRAPYAKKKLTRRYRSLETGLYVPDRKAQRHLTKPLSRYGLEKKMEGLTPPVGKWHDP